MVSGLHLSGGCYLFFLLKTFPPKLVLLDFSDIDSMEDVITEISECYGYVDVLLCNGSMKVKAPVQNLSLEMDKIIMDVNYFGPITLAKGMSVRTLMPLYSISHNCISLFEWHFHVTRYSAVNDCQKNRPFRNRQQHPRETCYPISLLL